MNQNERDIQRKLRILKYADEIGSAVKACRILGLPEPAFTAGRCIIKRMVKLD